MEGTVHSSHPISFSSLQIRLFMAHYFPSGTSETPTERHDQRLPGVPQGALGEREPPVHMSECGEHGRDRDTHAEQPKEVHAV